MVVLASLIAAGEWLRANSSSRPLSAEELETRAYRIRVRRQAAGTAALHRGSPLPAAHLEPPDSV